MSPSPTFISVGARVPVTSFGAVGVGAVWIVYRSYLGAIDNRGAGIARRISVCARQPSVVIPLGRRLILR